MPSRTLPTTRQSHEDVDQDTRLQRRLRRTRQSLSRHVFGSLGGASCCTQVQLRLRSLSDVLHRGVEGPDRARQHRQAKPNATQNFAMVDQSLEDQLHRTMGPKNASVRTRTNFKLSNAQFVRTPSYSNTLPRTARMRSICLDLEPSSTKNDFGNVGDEATFVHGVLAVGHGTDPECQKVSSHSGHMWNACASSGAEVHGSTPRCCLRHEYVNSQTALAVAGTSRQFWRRLLYLRSV